MIEASIDHSNSWLLSNEVVDLYSTEEPQKAFHKYVTRDVCDCYGKSSED